MQLLRFVEPLNLVQLEETLVGSSPASEPVRPELDLGKLEDAVKLEVQRLETATSDRQRARSDALLVEPVHTTMRGLERRDAADMRVWHWLTTVAFPDLVWRRWLGATPPREALPAALAGQLPRRFLGGSNLAGISRNTFARLWWLGEALVRDNDYGLARSAVEKQDLFQAVFERRMGLCPPLARACIIRLRDVPESRHRAVTQMVNHFATTTVLEVLDDTSSLALVEDAERAVDARDDEGRVES